MTLPFQSLSQLFYDIDSMEVFGVLANGFGCQSMIRKSTYGCVARE